MKNAIALVLLSLLIPSYATALSIHLPRSPSPKGGGGGGGGRGGGGGGGSRGGSSGGGRSGAGNTGLGGSGNTGKPAIISSQGRSANYFSGGGGKPFTLGSSSVFAGRQMGGGTRDQVTGTPRYGSGYPYYGAGYPYVGVMGQPFPFGFWPIYWGGHGYGYGREYHGNRTVNEQRPGGNLTMVELVPINGSSWNTSAVNGINETYWMIGDYESVTTLLSLLIYPANDSNMPYGCSCQNRTPSAFDTDNNSTNITVRFENVLQWYRSSSFALAYAGYNNTYALPPLNETGTLGWNDTLPFPEQQQNSAFLRCINATITAALPILDAPPSGGLSGGAIAGIVIGSIAGAILFGILTWFLFRRRQRREGKLKGKKGNSKTKASDSKHAKDASTAPLVEDSAPAGAGGWVGGFLSKKKGPNADEDDKPDIDGKKAPVDDEKKEKKGPADEHKHKSSHRDTESDESPNAGVTFPEPKAY